MTAVPIDADELRATLLARLAALTQRGELAPAPALRASEPVATEVDVSAGEGAS